MTGNSDIGSFFGPAEVSVDAPSNLATLCEAKRGIRTLTLAGTVIIGTQVIQTIPVGAGAGAVSSDGTHVWVAGSSVTELDASTGAVVQTIGVGNFPDAVSSDGSHVWVTNSGDNTVTELNASTGAVVQTIGVGSFPPNSISSDGTHVWVTSYDYIGNSVIELDASTGAGVGGIPRDLRLGSDPNGVSSDGAHAWVTNGSEGTVSEVAEQ